MNQATGFLNKYVVPVLTAVSENIYMSAIRAGMVSVVPLTIIGGLFTILAFMPINGWDKLVAPYLQLLQLPVTATFGLLAVFVCFSVSYDLGRQLKQEAIVSASMATVIFLMIQLNGLPTFSVRDLAGLQSLAGSLTHPKRPVDIWLADRLSDETKAALKSYQGGSSDKAPLQTALLSDLNTILRGSSIHDDQRFAEVSLRLETKELLSQNPQGNDLLLLNRLLLEDAYPQELSRHRPTLGEKPEDISFSMNNLGSKGLFTAILIALVVVRVQKFFTDKNLVIKMPANVPPVVYESFLSLIPLCFLVLSFWLIRFVLGVDIDHLVQTAFKPLVFALNTLPGILVYAFLVTMLWSVGINGDNAVDAIVAPIFLQYLAANVAAKGLGEPMPYVTALGFFTTFVNVGGTGATIALALVMWNSKDPGYRKVSRLSLPTQIFQINEPIFFGFPIVLNPILMIPYILNALILTTGSYLLIHWHVIQKPFVNVPWTTPPIIGHYLVSGGDWKAAVWGAASIAIAMAVYYPFAKIAERQRLNAEAAGVAHE